MGMFLLGLGVGVYLLISYMLIEKLDLLGQGVPAGMEVEDPLYRLFDEVVFERGLRPIIEYIDDMGRVGEILARIFAVFVIALLLLSVFIATPPYYVIYYLMMDGPARPTTTPEE